MNKRSDKEKKKKRSSLASKIISAIVISYLTFGAVIGIIGFCIFRYYFRDEYGILIYYMVSILVAAIVFAAVESVLSSNHVKKVC